MGLKLRAVQPKEYVGDEVITISTADSRYAKKTDLPNEYISLSSNQTISGGIKTISQTSTWKFRGDSLRLETTDGSNSIGLKNNGGKLVDLGNNQYVNVALDNTYASGKRNIFRTLPEVYTSSTLPTKDVDLTTKKYVDDKVASIPQPNNMVTTNTTQEISGTKNFTGGFNCQGTAAYRGHAIHVTNINDASNSDGSPWSGFLWGEGANQPMLLQGQNGLNVIAAKNTLLLSSPNGKVTLSGQTIDVNGQPIATQNYVNTFIKSKKVYWSSWGRVNESEHSGYYNSTFNYSSNDWANKTVFAVRIHTKNNSYSIQYGFQQNGSWIDLYIAGNRGFYNNMDYVELFYF